MRLSLHLLFVSYQGPALAAPQPAHPFFEKISTRRSRDQTARVQALI